MHSRTIPLTVSLSLRILSNASLCDANSPSLMKVRLVAQYRGEQESLDRKAMVSERQIVKGTPSTLSVSRLYPKQTSPMIEPALSLKKLTRLSTCTLWPRELSLLLTHSVIIGIDQSILWQSKPLETVFRCFFHQCPSNRTKPQGDNSFMMAFWKGCLMKHSLLTKSSLTIQGSKSIIMAVLPTFLTSPKGRSLRLHMSMIRAQYSSLCVTLLSSLEKVPTIALYSVTRLYFPQDLTSRQGLRNSCKAVQRHRPRQRTRATLTRETLRWRIYIHILSLEFNIVATSHSLTLTDPFGNRYHSTSSCLEPSATII